MCTLENGMARTPDRSDATLNDSTKVEHPNIIKRIINYFDDTNKEHKDKAFDISFIGGPHYSNEKQFGIGLLSAGVYSTNRGDSLTPPSNVSIYADINTTGCYTIGIEGTTRFKQDKFRLNYDLYFESMPDKFWGIGYDYDFNDDNETNYTRVTSAVKIDAQARLFDGFYVGPILEFTYIKGTTSHKDRLYLWQGEKMKTNSYALGIKMSYDTRDNLTAPHRGVNFMLEQRYYGKWMGNTYPFTSTQFTAACYTPTWKDCVLAMQYHTLITYGDTPWGQLAGLGGSHTMRGYYKNRYIDKGEMDIVAELRQRVYHRIGATVWCGAGTVFPRLDKIEMRHVLPNYGVGVRWEFKKNVNIRLDMGFGKNQKGVVFNINEAF